MRPGDETLQLPPLKVSYFSSVEDLGKLSPGDRFLQPPIGFAAIDSIGVVGNKAYLFQVTRSLSHKLNVGLLAVLAWLPGHLEVEFVWVLPIEIWQKQTFNSRDVPELDSDNKISLSQQDLISTKEELVAQRLEACRVQFKVGIPFKLQPPRPESPHSQISEPNSPRPETPEAMLPEAKSPQPQAPQAQVAQAEGAQA